MKDKKGFTLVELLAVIVVLGIIALIGFTSIGDIIENVKVASNKATIGNYARAIKDAKVRYLALNGSEAEINKSWVITNVDFSTNNFECNSISYDNDLTMMGCKFDDDTSTYCYIAGKSLVNEGCYGGNGNLVDNGYLENGNTNFTGLTYDEEEQAIKFSHSTSATIMVGNRVDVDTSKKYEISLDLKVEKPDGTKDDETIFYVGIVQYDSDGNQIKPQFVGYCEDTLVELAEPLNNGSTEVKLKQTGTNPFPNGWLEVSASTGKNGFIFWDYKDYAPETYSMNASTDLFEEVPTFESNIVTVKLKTPWNKGNKSAGTKLSRSRSGTLHNYGLVIGKPLNNSYETKIMTIGGLIDDGNPDIRTKFRPGTEAISLFVLYDYTRTGNNSNLYIKNILIRQV